MHFVQDVICCKVTYFQSLFNALRINLINVYKKKKLKHLDYRDTKQLALPHGKSFFLCALGQKDIITLNLFLDMLITENV